METDSTGQDSTVTAHHSCAITPLDDERLRLPAAYGRRLRQLGALPAKGVVPQYGE